ncbi:MAG: D-serine ammonia-lyase [Desulfovibrionaceae bacterium]|nr:D-serine ammonia-lyase [Desulfovibrionaceae bacterium]
MSEMSGIPEVLHGRQWKEWLAFFPQIGSLAAGKPVLWNNNHGMAAGSALSGSGFTPQDVEDASLRLRRFTPFLGKVFPDMDQDRAFTASPLRESPAILETLTSLYHLPACANILFKLDNQLPFSGSVKDRGGVYEVLKLAESLAIYAEKLKWTDDYSRLVEPEMREFYSQFGLSIISGSSLGLAAGLAGKALGFRAMAHISASTERWKKEALRAGGIELTEHQSGYEEMLKSAYETAQKDAHCFLISEPASSRDMLLGYAIAGFELKEQLAAQGIEVNAAHPLYVYLPCSSGLEASGLCLGLKFAFLNDVRCFLAEPVYAPVVSLGLGTGLFDHVSTREIGLDGKSIACAMAYDRPSKLTCQVLRNILDGCVTVDDKVLLRLLALLRKYEQIKVEPAAVAGLAAYIVVGYSGQGRRFEHGTHVVWFNSGGLMPEEAIQEYFQV